jgi:transcriptional antiterminator NusG
LPFEKTLCSRLFQDQLNRAAVFVLYLVAGSTFPRRGCGIPGFRIRIMAFIEKQNDRYWGFAYLRPRTEKKVAEGLAGRNIPGYLPLVNKARLHHGTKIVTPLPMIPGYIFLAVDEPERNELKRTEKNIVNIHLLRVPMEEETLIRELNALHQFELLAQTQEVHVNPGIQRGDKVIVTQGPLKGLETEVIRREDARNAIIVNVTILEKTVEYPISADELKKITS